MEDEEERRVKEDAIADLHALLATPADLEKVPAMLEDARRKQAATGAALSELIALHCDQLRAGVRDVADALADIEALRRRLATIQQLCADSHVLTAGETRLAASLAVVQGNIRRTITSVEQVYEFPARADEALEALAAVDAGDAGVMVDVFADLSALLTTQSVAEALIDDMRARASAARVGGDDMDKVETYFGRVQRAQAAFADKLLSHFDDPVATARRDPRALVVALRVVLMQEATWKRLQAVSSVERNPWGASYRDLAVKRMQLGASQKMQPIVADAEQVFARWMQVHGRTAASAFLAGPSGHRVSASGGGPLAADFSTAGGAGGTGDAVSAGDSGGGLGGRGAAAAAALGGAGARLQELMRGAGFLKAGTGAITARLVGGVGRAPIQLQSMPGPAAGVEDVGWLAEVQTDEAAIETLAAALQRADEVVESLVDVYDTALPCFPAPLLNPVVTIAEAHAASASHLLDALGQAAPVYDNATLLTLLAWPSAFRATLRGLGLSDEHAAIPLDPRVATPHGERVRMHGLDVARLVYIDRIRRQLAKAFKNVAEDDLVREPEPDGRGRLWTPGVIELFRFLTQQVQLAASVRDSEVMRNVASVALQVMQSYQDLVLSALADKGMTIERHVAVLNNNLIAYDRSRDLAGAIGDALRTARDSGSAPGEAPAAAGRAEGDEEEMERDGREPGGADNGMNREIEDVCRGFLAVAKAALERAVQAIFADSGFVDLCQGLCRSEDWRKGVTTSSLLLTLSDYLQDLQAWLDGPFYRRALVHCLNETVRTYRNALLGQLPAGGLGEEEAERFEEDILAVRDYYNKAVALDKVEAALEPLEALIELAQCGSVEEFEERYGFMLHRTSGRGGGGDGGGAVGGPPLKPAEVAALCAKRSDISAADAAAIARECEKLYSQWLAEGGGEGGRGGGVSPRGGDGGEEEVGLLAKMYKRVVKAVQAAAAEE